MGLDFKYRVKTSQDFPIKDKENFGKLFTEDIFKLEIKKKLVYLKL